VQTLLVGVGAIVVVLLAAVLVLLLRLVRGPGPGVGASAGVGPPAVGPAQQRQADTLLERASQQAAELVAAGQRDAAALRTRAEAEAAAAAAAAERTARAAPEAEEARVAAAASTAAAAASEAGLLVSREELAANRAELASREERLAVREDRLTQREERAVAETAASAERRHAARLAHEQAEADLTRRRAALEGAEAAWEHQCRAELERVATLTAAAAKAELVATLSTRAKREAAVLIRDLEAEARRGADRTAREVVSQAIARVAGEQTAESVVSVVHLPAEEMKGRIIGREGRNIRTFETVTGVNVLIDDTPGAVALSCFDPVRREVANRTLAALVADGRIHPQRIEETHARAVAEVADSVQRAGEDALVEVGIDGVHPELVTLLGRLRYRTSYGQNVLRHLVETAHIASGMAAEVGLGREGIATVKRGAFLHDVGKALTHEVEGSHARVGADLARRLGESDDVVHAIEAHHLEVPPTTVEAWLTIGSDSCSGGWPGARRESLESYVERLTRIEAIAKQRAGVEKVFAMSAGRELRVMVLPDEVDDLGAQVLARDIAAQIEDELTYPGQVRVTVVRESRATGTAH